MLGAGPALGVLEQAMRAALTSAGARAAGDGAGRGDDGYAGRTRRAAAATRPLRGGRDKTVITVLGPVTLRRAWYHCAECRHGFAPRDQQLGITGGSLSPGLAEMTALAGAEVSFARAAGLLAGPGRDHSSAPGPSSGPPRPPAPPPGQPAPPRPPRSGRRIVPLPPPEPVPDMLYVEVDGTGVPVRASETEGRPGKDGDGRPAPGRSSSPACSPCRPSIATAGR